MNFWIVLLYCLTYAVCNVSGAALIKSEWHQFLPNVVLGVFSFSGKTHPYALHRYDPDFDRYCANCLG